MLFFSIGINGLAGLISLSPHSFDEFSETLFSETLKNQDRMLLGKDENVKLDKLIDKFLSLVSPHLLHSSAFKALEWLIKRYRIHEFNIDSFLRCALPFHDTWQFTRVLGTIKLSGKWSWLTAQREKKVSLDRSTLVHRLQNDMAFFEFVCETMEVLLLPSPHSNASLCSFFTGTMIEFISTAKFDDNLMRVLMPRLFIMAAVDNPNVQAASYMVLSHLSNQIPLAKEVLGAMTDVIIDRASSTLGKFACCCLLSIFDAQDNCLMISVEALGTLLHEGSFWNETLGEVLGVYQGDALTLGIFYSFFQQRKQEICTSNYSSFMKFVNCLTLTAPLAERLCSFALEDAALEQSHSDIVHVKNLLLFISKSFPLVMNKQVAYISQDSKVFDIISSAFAGTAHEPLPESNTTLFLSLQHPDKDIRFLGYQRLVAIIKSNEISPLTTLANNDLSYIPQTLASGLVDPNPKIPVLVAAIPHLVDFLSLVPGDDGIKRLCELSKTSRLSDPATSKAVFDHFLKLDLISHPQCRDEIISHFLMGKETLSTFVHASTVVKTGPTWIASLFEGIEALAKEIISAEKNHKGQELAATLNGIYVRVSALIAANVAKDESNKLLFVLFEALSSTNVLTGLLSVSVLTYILSSPQYNERILVVSNALLTHLKSSLKVTNLSKVAGVDALSVLPSLQNNNLKALEDTYLLEGLSLIVSGLPRLRKQGKPVPVFEYHDCIEKDIFEVLMSLRAFKNSHDLFFSFFEGHLKLETLPFLVNMFLSPSCPQVTQVQCLKMVSMVLQAETEGKLEVKDYQVIVPSLLVAFTRSKVVREQAIDCLSILKAMQSQLIANVASKKGKTATPIFLYDTFYGAATGKIMFLQSQLIQSLISALLETSQELISDASYICRRIGDILFKKVFDQQQSENVLTFLLTTVLALPISTPKFELLSTLKAVLVPQKVKTLQPLFDSVFGNGETVNPCLWEQDMQLRLAMIDCFSAVCVSTIFGYRSGRFLNLFLKIVETGEEKEALHALNLINPVWFSNAKSHHQAIFSTLIYVSSRRSKDIAYAAKRIIKTVSVNSEVILAVIAKCKASIANLEDLEQHSKRSKNDSTTLSDINELITILELLDATSNITNKGELVGALFELLGFVLQLEVTRVPVSLEYLKQLLITAKLNIVKSLKEVNATVDESLIRVDLIVSCIRVSDNPQTHNEALLLLAELSDVYPSTVLINVIPILTFMGANVLRRDDDYSFHVIQQTLSAIIPPLINSSKKKLDLKSVIEVFIESIFHIPRHRRLRLFTILVSTLGPTQFFDSVILMLLLKSSQKFSDVAMVNPSDIASLSPFCLSLIQQFDTLVQLKVLASIIEGIHLIPDNSEVSADLALGSVALDLKGFTSNEIRHFKLVSLDFVNNVLSAVVDDTTIGAAREADVLFHSLFQTTLTIIVDVLGTKSLQQATESKNPYFRSLSKRLNSILSHLNHLISLPSFLELALTLLDHGDVSICVRVTELTRDKLENIDTEMYNSNSENVHAIFKKLSTFIADSDSLDHVSRKISTLECINLMLIKFAETTPQVFASVLPTLTAERLLLVENRQIRRASLECIRTCITTLGPRLIPFIKKIMKAIFDILATLKESLVVDQLCILALSCIDASISSMPQFLSPFLPEILQSMFLPYDELTGGKETLGKFRNTKNDVSSNISKSIPVRTLVPMLAKQVSHCFRLSASAALDLFEVTSMTISHMEKNDLTAFMNDLVKFFLTSFEFRKKYQSQYNTLEIDKVEGAIISAFVQLVLRLNESHFKPMFFKIVDWAFNANGGKENILVLYRLSGSLLDKLKTIFSPYALHLVDHSIELLSEYKKDSVVDKQWELIVVTINKFLQYSSGPVSEDVFNKLTKCFCNQIDLVAAHGRAYLSTMTRHIVPTIGLLAVNVGQESMWKILNKEIMKKSRNENVLSRIVTIKCLHEFYVLLGEEFLILLPETVPTIAELMEDGDERVQVACQELTSEIQKHLGEDLNSYFA